MTLFADGAKKRPAHSMKSRVVPKSAAPQVVQGENGRLRCATAGICHILTERILHETNNFIARLTHAMNINIFTFTPGRPTGEILVEQTDGQTDKVTTVTLAAHARRGLII